MATTTMALAALRKSLRGGAGVAWLLSEIMSGGVLKTQNGRPEDEQRRTKGL